MSRTRFLSLLSVIALLFCGTASAQTMSAKGNIVVTKQVTGMLSVLWSESGLAPNQEVSYEVMGTASATYACVAGSTATALPSVSDPVSVGLALVASSTGTIRQTVGVGVPDATSAASRCSGNVVLYQVSYTGMYVCDLTTPLPCTPVGSGNFTQTFCNLTKSPGRCPPA